MNTPNPNPLNTPNKRQDMDRREGFGNSDPVTRKGAQADGIPALGVVQGWSTYECGPLAWYCLVTWGGQHIGRHQANELEHAPAAVEAQRQA